MRESLHPVPAAARHPPGRVRGAARLSAPRRSRRCRVLSPGGALRCHREGLTFIEAMPDARLPAFSLAYLEEEQRVAKLADAGAASGHSYAPEVEALLLQGGVRVAAEATANRW